MRTRGSLALVALLLGAAGCSAATAYIHPSLTPVAPEPASYRLLLIGDGGEFRQPEPVLTVAAIMAGRMAGRATAIYLGDNAYPAGISGSAKQRATAEQTLARQADGLSASAHVLFVPGNHDWAEYGRGGLAAIAREADFVKSRGADFLPAAGCPGPEWTDLPKAQPVVRVVALDTQWWLHKFERRDDCMPGTPEAIGAALRAAMKTSLPVVVAAHHPLATHGEHGGFFDWRAHIFPLRDVKRLKKAWIPLPGLGSLYPLVRRAIRHEQDLKGRRNSAMRAVLVEALTGAAEPPVVVFAAAHDHSMQVLKGPGADFTLVSGSGSSNNQTSVTTGPDSLYAHKAAGFMVIDVRRDHLVLAVVDPADPPTWQRWFRLRR